MRERVTSDVRQGLVNALGGATTASESGTRPNNQEAYDLFLRSLAVSHDAAPNKQAIALLEHVIVLDPTYAQAWAALGFRYYFDAHYGGGGEAMFKRSVSAYERALALDPNLIFAASQLILERTERGDLQDSYAEALALVNRWPKSAEAHFALGYVLGYAGLLEQAGRECDTAISFDSENSKMRSCAWAFIQLGQSDKAMKFLDLDRGSEWAARVTPFLLLGEGRLKEARESVNKMPPGSVFGRDLLQACLNPEQGRQVESSTREFESATISQLDPEQKHINGSLLAFCGKKEQLCVC